MDTLVQLTPAPVRRSLKNLVSMARYRLRINRATPALVFQMGKVGSTSIFRSLLKQYPGAVIHAHNLTSQHTDPVIRYVHQWAITENRKLKVISLIREPISRNVSAFFQNLEQHTAPVDSKTPLSTEDLKMAFLSNYNHDIPLEWFDNNIPDNFGIDVYSTPFPKNGVASYRNGNIDLLILRLEISDEDKSRAIAQFLGLNKFEINKANVGEDKEYSAAYEAFKKSAKLPTDYIDKMCESKYFNHFYSEEDIESARKKWSGV